MYLIKLVRIRIHSQHRAFPLFCLAQEGFRRIQRRWKDSERLGLRAVPEEFLHKKVNNKDAYVDYGAAKDIPEDACSLRQYGDLTALN